MAVTTQPETIPPTGHKHSPLKDVSLGLNFITSLDELTIKRRAGIVQALACCRTQSEYDVFSKDQQKVLNVYEESELCNRTFCGSCRGFTYHIIDNQQKEVLSVNRVFKCGNVCSNYDEEPMYVCDGEGQLIGMIKLTISNSSSHYAILDHTERPLYQVDIGLSQCDCSCSADTDLSVKSSDDGSKVADIVLSWGGCIREVVCNAHTYCVNFPKDLNVIHKALILAFGFYMDGVVQ